MIANLKNNHQFIEINAQQLSYQSSNNSLSVDLNSTVLLIGYYVRA
jgi:hypothetical protein